MKRASLSSFSGLLGLAALFTLAMGMVAAPAQAVTVGVLPVGDTYAKSVSADGPNFTRDFHFELGAGANNVTILASALAADGGDFGINNLIIRLFDESTNVKLAEASGAPFAFFDSFASSGLLLGPGAYLFRLIGDVPADKDAFVQVAISANSINQVPIPAAGLLLLTGLGALGGLAARRRSKTNASAA